MEPELVAAPSDKAKSGRTNFSLLVNEPFEIRGDSAEDAEMRSTGVGKLLKWIIGGNLFLVGSADGRVGARIGGKGGWMERLWNSTNSAQKRRERGTKSIIHV